MDIVSEAPASIVPTELVLVREMTDSRRVVPCVVLYADVVEANQKIETRFARQSQSFYNAQTFH